MEENKNIERIIESNNCRMENKIKNTRSLSLIPNEVHNMNKLMQSLSNISSYSWKNDGDKILNSGKIFTNVSEKRILKYLIPKKVPINLRPNVR